MPDITIGFSPDVTYWVKSAWKEVNSEIMKHCLKKCGFPFGFM